MGLLKVMSVSGRARAIRLPVSITCRIDREVYGAHGGLVQSQCLSAKALLARCVVGFLFQSDCCERAHSAPTCFACLVGMLAYECRIRCQPHRMQALLCRGACHGNSFSQI